MFEKLDDIESSNDDTVFVNADFDNVTFFSDDMGLANVDLNNVSTDDDNFDISNPETIMHVRLMPWCN